MELKFEKIERKHGEIHFVMGRLESRGGSESGGGGRVGQNSGGNRKGRSHSKSRDRAKGIKFYGCGKLGYFISECYKVKNKQRDHRENNETNVVVPREEFDEIYILLNFKSSEINLSMNSHIDE
ncbi:hypothetical protein Adt_38959 [Abeliophyllum distichum]|uniref:Uncharacterized protein n=1 Tax=Abeliophyllum distichum TaxID=126358 RepID=A0ABD1Q3Q5_9LAMI